MLVERKCFSSHRELWWPLGPRATRPCPNFSLSMSEAVKIFKAAGITDVVNVSQQINRMRLKQREIVPCITPHATLYDLRRDRLLLPYEKLLLMGFPVDELDLSKLSYKEPLLN